jgi:hypothetical protein
MLITLYSLYFIQINTITFDNINTISYFIKYKTINIYIIIYQFFKFINDNFLKVFFYLFFTYNYYNKYFKLF